MYSRIFVLILAVGIGVGIGALTVSRLASDDPSVEGLLEHTTDSLVGRLTQGESSEVDSEQLVRVVESLIQILDEEISERRVLEEQFKELQSEVADLQQNLRVRVQEAFEMEGNSGQQQSDTGEGRTIEERLAAAGFTQLQLESIQRLEAEAQMQQIELDDRARREGWSNTQRYREEWEKISTGANFIRDTIGDDAYDRYLFASGRPNRIAVQSVIPTSPAEKAGFQAGDIVMSYGGESVYSMLQINNLRSSGEKGAPVIVEVIRNGQLMQISIPRGPMGLNGGPTRFDPSGLGNE